MTVGTIAQDRTMKLPIPDAATTTEGAEDEAAAFGKLLAQLGGKEGDETNGETIIAPLAGNDEGVPAEPVGPLNIAVDMSLSNVPSALQALLASAVSTIVHDVKADVGATNTARPAGDSDILKLAQLIAQNAKGVQDVGLDMPDDGKAIVFPDAEVTLETWVNGPHSVAALTTGAQEKRPMDLAVVGVATHFAPVVDPQSEVSRSVAGERLVVPEQIKEVLSTGAKGDGVLVGNSAAVLPTNAHGSGAGGSSEGRSDNSRDLPKADLELTADVSTEFASVGETADDMDINGQHQQTPAIKQIANEVARAVEIRQPAPVTFFDSKPALGKLKVLHIQLQPETLGTVTVKMELRGSALELHVDAARAETAELIQRDREVLSSILKAAGYNADDAQIKVTHADPSISATLSANTDSSLSSSQSGSQSTQDRSSQSQGRDTGARRDREPEQRERPAHEDGVHRRGEAAGVYL